MARRPGQRRNAIRPDDDFIVDPNSWGQRRTGGSGADEFVVDLVERRIARTAATQDGIASRRQLRSLGVGAKSIDHRVAIGRYTVLFRGVYAIGHAAVSARGWARAALLAIGPDAVLSHWTAAWIWSLCRAPSTVHVSLTRRLRPRAGLTPHTVTLPLAPDEVRQRDGLRVTSPFRTLQDLRRDPDIERMVAEAQRRRLITREEAARLVADPAPTRSEFERAFRRLVEEAGLPRPLVNHHVAGRERDFVWPEQRVVVETDGWETHGTKRAFEDDRDRDAGLAALGWLVVRITWRQLMTEPFLVAARLAGTLALRGAGLPG